MGKPESQTIDTDGPDASPRIDVDAAMALLGLGRSEVYRSIKDGALKAEKVDHRVWLDRSSVETLAAQKATTVHALDEELARWSEELAAGAEPTAEPMADDATVADRVAALGQRLLTCALVGGADDVYLDPIVDGDRVLFHVGGRRQDRGRLTPDLSARLKAWLKEQAPVVGGGDGASQGVGHLERDGTRHQFRLVVVPTLMGEHIHIRLFAATAELVDLGYTDEQVDALRTILSAGSGVVLLADAADAWSERNRRAIAQTLSTGGRLVVSLEHRLQHRSELLIQLDLAAEDRPPFDELWRAALAMDPDVVIVDELRSAEQARLVVDGATGGLVIAQVMASGAEAARRKLRTWEVAEDVLALVSLGAVQRFGVRQLCPGCRREADGDGLVGVARQFLPVGCDACVEGFLGTVSVCGVAAAGDDPDAPAGLRSHLRRAVEDGRTPLAPVRAWLVDGVGVTDPSAEA